MFKIEHEKQFCGTDAWMLGYQAVVELHKQGNISKNYIITWDDQVLVARTNRGTLAGLIAYRHLEHERSFLITLGYVKPTYRQRGVYRQLWDALVERAQKEEIREIDSGTYLNNKRMQKVMPKLGRKLTTFNYTFTVPYPAKEKQDG